MTLPHARGRERDVPELAPRPGRREESVPGFVAARPDEPTVFKGRGAFDRGEIALVAAIGSRGRDTLPVSRTTSIDELAERARRLATAGTRRILGITGAPGAGKSTLAAAMVAELGGLAVTVPMDGFHLTNSELDRLGRRERKGAPDTFDAEGYVALLRRIRADDDDVVSAPEFPREADEPLSDRIAVPRHVPLVITEGNYLLLDRGPWAAVRTLVDEVWYLAPDNQTRIDRLIDRHVRHGKSPDEARAWVARSDESNARLVALTRDRADVIVTGWSSR
jgi:pantothenate kinase